MEPSVVIFLIVTSIAVWFQLSYYTFSFNVIASTLAVLLLLYFTVVTHSLFPLERILFILFYKERTKSPKKSNSVGHLPFEEITFDDEITRKLRELTGHIVRDFILDWYNTVSDDVHFVQESFELFDHVFTCIRTRVASVDSQLFLNSVVRFLSRHLDCYRQAVTLANEASPQDLDRKQQLIIITYEKLLGHLAMSNYPDTEEEHLRSLTTVLLKAFLPTDYRLTGASLYLVRELISKNVFFPVVELLSDPVWINQSVVLILNDEEADESDDTSEESEGSTASVDFDDVGENLVLPTHTATNPATPCPDSIVPTFPKQEKDINKVSFSVLENEDHLDLDISYNHLPTNSTSNYGKSTSSVEERLLKSPLAEPVTDPHEKIITSNSTEVAANIPSHEGGESMRSGDTLKATGYLDHNELLTGSGNKFPSVPTTPTSRSEEGSFHDDRLFQRIRIFEAVTMEEPYEGRSKYTLYNVEYWAPPLPNNSQSLQIPEDPSERHYGDPDHLQPYRVKRRFREFLNLQDRLNEKPLMRRLLSDVRAPSRMFPMPIGNMEKDYIEKRRKFLQAYLREVCTFPHVNTSDEMKEFLAYNTDPRIAFVRRPSQFIPRFDKMFKNAVRDFFGAASDKISDTISRTDQVDWSSSEKTNEFQQTRISELPEVVVNQELSAPPSDTNPDTIQPQGGWNPKSLMQNPVTVFKNMVLGKRTDLALYEEGLRDFTPFSGPRNANEVRSGRKWRTPENLIANRTHYYQSSKRRRSQGDGCDQMYELEDEDHTKKEDHNITGRVFRLVHQIWDVDVGTNSLLYVSLGKYVKKFVDLRVEELTKKDQWLFYLQSFLQALWPDGSWRNKKEEEDGSMENDSYSEALRVLEDVFPDALRYVVGSGPYKAGVATLLDSVQNPAINRHVVYHLLDILITFLLPNLPSLIASSTNVSL